MYCVNFRRKREYNVTMNILFEIIQQKKKMNFCLDAQGDADFLGPHKICVKCENKIVI